MPRLSPLPGFPPPWLDLGFSVDSRFRFIPRPGSAVGLYLGSGLCWFVPSWKHRGSCETVQAPPTCAPEKAPKHYRIWFACPSPTPTSWRNFSKDEGRFHSYLFKRNCAKVLVIGMSTERGSHLASGSPRLTPCTCVAWVDDLVQATYDSAPGPPLQNKRD